MAEMSDESRRLQAEARRFAHEEVLPVANQLDPERAEIPDSLLARLAELGYFGILIAKEHGGLGRGVFDYCLVTEELARAWMSVASVIAYANGYAAPAEEERRARYLERMARGELLVAFALTEPEAGSDAAALSCDARREGGHWVIRGRKRWCGFAKAADAILVYARTQAAKRERRHLGISAFLVEKPRGRFPPGISGRPIAKIGYFGITSWELDFDGLRVPADALVGEEGMAFRDGMEELTKARAQTAARAVGVARGALEDALAYARERRQFGRPLSDFQAIRFKLAWMATEVEAARRLVYHAARRLDDREQAIVEASMAKLFASEMAERVTSEALQIHGGNGYTTDFAVERHWRDARLTRIIEGTSEIQSHIIAKRLLEARG
jgi:alkylation response protein AidB-like acyl-CoA dehydrogenase